MPVFTPVSYQNAGGNNAEIVDKLEEMNNRIEIIAQEQSSRIDRLEVVQVTRTATDAQKKEARQSSLGVLKSKR